MTFVAPTDPAWHCILLVAATIIVAIAWAAYGFHLSNSGHAIGAAIALKSAFFCCLVAIISGVFFLSIFSGSGE
jgi:hypothetical protein